LLQCVASDQFPKGPEPGSHSSLRVRATALRMAHSRSLVFMACANYATDQLFAPGTCVSILERAFDLHLCEAAIDKQFRSRHEATVIRCEKHHGLRDLFGFAEPADRDSIGNHF